MQNILLVSYTLLSKCYILADMYSKVMCRITTIVYFYSYQCGGNYHAPTDCETIKRWLTKCADDSETANYISAHTKDVSFYKPYR